MPTFFVLLFTAYLSGNVYIFIRGWQALSGLPTGLRVLIGLVYWLGALLLLLMWKIREWNISAVFAHYLHEIGTGWLVFTLYMVISLLFVDILKLLHVRYAYSFYVVLGIVWCVLCYGYINYKNVRIKTIDLAIDKPIDSIAKQVKIAAISDVHLGAGTNKSALKKYVKLINEQQPDMLLIAGDLIDNSVTPLRTERMEEELRQLKAPMGIYMVSGNHEYISGIRESADFLNQTPIQLLCDSIATLPNGIQIVGRHDRSNRFRLPVADLMRKADISRPLILMDHQPLELEKAVAAGVDLQISGHTHDGQVWPINLITNRMFELSYGYKKKGNTHFYTSSGLSLWGPPFRISSVSELVIINLTFN